MLPTSYLEFTPYFLVYLLISWLFPTSLLEFTYLSPGGCLHIAWLIPTSLLEFSCLSPGGYLLITWLMPTFLLIFLRLPSYLLVVIFNFPTSSWRLPTLLLVVTFLFSLNVPTYLLEVTYLSRVTHLVLPFSSLDLQILDSNIFSQVLFTLHYITHYIVYQEKSRHPGNWLPSLWG